MKPNLLSMIVLCGLVLTPIVTPSTAQARVTRFEVRSRESPTFEGRDFGTTGQYERLSGLAYGELDPNDPLNSVIVNIARAPRNARGRVEYVVDFYLLKPVDLTLGNAGILYDALGGGSKGVHLVLNSGSGDNDPHLYSDAGNGFMMNQGWTIVWSAWQGDVDSSYGRMVARLPVATSSTGRPIVGLSREELIDESGDSPFTGNLSYAASTTLAAGRATLTVRQNERDPRQTPAGLRWRYLSSRQIEITRPAGFDAGAIYEFIYPAKDPTVLGVGIAATRDVVSFLRYAGADDTMTPNPLVATGTTSAIQYVQAIGFSQPGKFLRDFIYHGFNQDEARRVVFDGVQPVVSGGRRTFTNYQFGQPNRGEGQHADHNYPGSEFPFSYTTLTDPISGRTDGILARCLASNSCPKIMQADSDSELWQGHGSLVVTDSAGNDVPLLANVRLHMFAGAQHGPNDAPIRGICQQYDSPLEWTYHIRALTLAMRAWIVFGTLPPPSRYPTRASGTLVPPDPMSTGWPNIPYVNYGGFVNPMRLLDFSVLPAREGAPYTVLVARVDADGNALGGVRHPYIVVPDATYSGWNLRALGHAPGELCELSGTYVPFYGTRADREANGDPRLSKAERYPDHRTYVDRVAAAVDQLIAERLILPEDKAEIVFLADQRAIP